MPVIVTKAGHQGNSFYESNGSRWRALIVKLLCYDMIIYYLFIKEVTGCSVAKTTPHIGLVNMK